MKASLFYRIAAVLLVLFAAGHTLGFRQNNPEWGVGPLIGSMQSVHLNAQGFDRTYWDFFSAFGFFTTIFLLFSAIVAWQLGGLSSESFGTFGRRIAWALSISFVAFTVLSWIYAFTTPIVFSTLITACLITAVWLSPKVT